MCGSDEVTIHAGHAGHLEREAHEAAAKDAKRAKVKTKMESKVAGKDAAAASESKPPSKDAAAVAAAASASEPLFPKWFTQLPSGWQGSYTNYSAIRDSEANLKQRLSSLSTPEDIRREVRNMVFCAFISALALETFSSGGGSCGVSGSAASSASSAGTASASQSAQNIEKALFTGCGGTITADYRRRYRLLAMALRSSQHLRAALARCALTPASLVAMSCAELDAYGKVPATSNSSKQAAPLPSPTHKLKEVSTLKRLASWRRGPSAHYAERLQRNASVHIHASCMHLADTRRLRVLYFFTLGDCNATRLILRELLRRQEVLRRCRCQVAD